MARDSPADKVTEIQIHFSKGSGQPRWVANGLGV